VENVPTRGDALTTKHEPPTFYIRSQGRPSKEQMMMMMAYSAASRSACARRRSVGSIIVTTDMTNVIAIGYNGPPRGVNEPCTLTPDVPGTCTCVHAEANALVKASYVESFLFTTMAPCAACARLIMNSLVRAVFYHEAYRDTTGTDLLRGAGIQVIPVKLWVSEEDNDDGR